MVDPDKNKYKETKGIAKGGFYGLLTAIVMLLIDLMQNKPPQWASITVGGLVIAVLKFMHNWLKVKQGVRLP